MYCTVYNLLVLFLYPDLQFWCVHCIKLHLHVDHAYHIKGTLITQCGKSCPHCEETLCSFTLKSSAGALFSNKNIDSHDIPCQYDTPLLGH